MDMTPLFEEDVDKALDVLRRGGLLLYPTDTVWGLGCDATNETAIQKIYDLKERDAAKSFIVLLADERDLLQYIAAPDPAVFDFLEQQPKPTTIIFDDVVGLPGALLAADGSLGIRLVRDPFCRHLIKRLRAPLVSTSANKSGQPSPQVFRDISDDIKLGVDYVVRWRQEETAPAAPSTIIKWHRDGSRTVLRP
jgi:L-threonylcarbamoyladenylate synthase